MSAKIPAALASHGVAAVIALCIAWINGIGGKFAICYFVSASAGGVRLTGGVIANCTILNSYGKYAGGLNASGGTVYNTVVYGCTNLVGEVSPTSGSASRFVNCATDAATAINETCVIVGLGDFVNAAAGNYTPHTDGVLYNAGTAVELRSTTDLAGNPRIASKGIDIGAYESKGKGLCVMFR